MAAAAGDRRHDGVDVALLLWQLQPLQAIRLTCLIL